MFLLWLWYMMSWIAAVVMARLCWRASAPARVTSGARTLESGSGHAFLLSLGRAVASKPSSPAPSSSRRAAAVGAAETIVALVALSPAGAHPSHGGRHGKSARAPERASAAKKNERIE